jgi:demethylmenaquinone methyltransferase/2-methoxy-6-polyprenyl-1,4-benzoquinol methylase
VSKYYQPGAERQNKVNELFSRIAPRYDLINDLQSAGLHRYWKRRLLGAAHPKPGEKALDLCCGTGDVAFALAHEGLQVTGLDLNPAMLAVAEKRKTSQVNPQFVCADAARTPYPDASFDLVTISYGLRNLPDWRKGLEEMWRVTRPGGRFLILDFGHPDNPTWRRIYFGYLRRVVPIFGQLFCGDRDTHGYILESLRHYPGQRGVDSQLRTMPCAEVRVLNLLGGIMSINYARRR